MKVIQVIEGLTSELEKQFLKEIGEFPTCLTPFFAYSDWLMENGWKEKSVFVLEVGNAYTRNTRYRNYHPQWQYWYILVKDETHHWRIDKKSIRVYHSAGGKSFFDSWEPW